MVYIYVVIVYFLIKLPFYFLVNKYVITIIPILEAGTIFWLLRKEIAVYNLNVFRNKDIHTYAFNALKYSILIQAIFNIVTMYTLKMDTDFIAGVGMVYPVVPIYSVILAPILEEIVFRKIIFSYINKYNNFWIAAISSSLLFAFVHQNAIAFLGLFFSGILYCYFYKKSGSLAPTIIAHITLNFLVIVASTLKSQI